MQLKASGAEAPARAVNEANARPVAGCPSPEEVTAGLQFIKTNLPEETESLEQLEFVIVNRTNASPIHKWPSAVIEQAIKKINTIRGDATSEYFYPLLSFDLKRVVREGILPRLLPFAREHGLFIAGPAGVGKTPLVKILGYLLCGFWCKEKKLETARSSLRRGKKLERFRAKGQQVIEMLLLDDPILELLNWESLKDFFELTEIGFGDGRYTDSKYCLNGPRALVTNVLNYDNEPGPNEAFTVSHFWEIVKPTFGPLDDFHKRAIYKRCIALLICKHRIMLRLPSEHLETEPIAEYKEDDAHKDLLVDTNKPYLDKWRMGEHVKCPNYDAKVSEEMIWAEAKIKAEKRRDSLLNIRNIEADLPRPDLSSSNWPPANPHIHLKTEVLSDQQIARAIMAAQEMEREGIIELGDSDSEQMSAQRQHCHCFNGSQTNLDTHVKMERMRDQPIVEPTVAAQEMRREIVIEVDDSDTERVPISARQESMTAPRLIFDLDEVTHRSQKDGSVKDSDVDLERELERMLE